MGVCFFRNHTPARGTLQQSRLNKIRFVVVLKRILRLSDGNRKGFRTDRPSAVVFDNGAENLPVIVFLTEPVNVQFFQPLCNGCFEDSIAAFNERKIPHTPQ